MKKSVFLVLVLFFVSILFFCDEPSKSLYVFESSMTVYGERIPLEQKEIVSTPAPIIVITQEEIKEKGAKTLSEIIEFSAGALSRDITGNPVERSVDLRGFPDGTKVVVFLDGVKLNNISDNSMNFEIVPVEIIDRIEIYTGALAPLYGGGAIGGVINIITKKGESLPRLDLTYGIGSFGERDQKITFGGAKGKFSLYSSVSLRYSEGYRENDGYRLDDGFFKMGYAFNDKKSLSFIFKYEGGSTSAPGALTEEEIKEDRKQSPYNKFDGNRRRHKIYALTYSQKIGENSDFALQVFSRSHISETLTTGRYLSGFQTKSNEILKGGVAQFSQNFPVKKGVLGWSSSIEYQQGKDASKGYYTNFEGDILSSASSSKTKEKILAGYLKAFYTLAKCRFDLGYRKESAKYKYLDNLTPTNSTDKTFNEGTLRGSFSYFVTDEMMIFAAASEGYKIPSVTELFSYPGFYSNPDLKPSRVNDYEIGYKYFGEKWRTKITFYRMLLRDEAVFVLTNPDSYIGMNENIGKSYRKGVEGDFSVDFPNNLTFNFSGTLRKTKVTDGLHIGKELPMTAKNILNFSVAKRIDKFLASFGGRYVGNQYLANDLSNKRDKLLSYFVAFLNFNYTK
ncbi:MAG: TonB-dependent receptor, partial [Acidobacteria bacterium]|nr:TonB-dependent receptor [Acidobacteriota bacterium]